MAKPTAAVSPDTARVFRALQTSDDIGALLRVHFDAERALSQVVNEAYIDAKALNLKYFGQKLGALAAIGVLPLRLEPLVVLNKIRNDFAHRGRELIEDQDVKGLWDAINKYALGSITPDFSIIYGLTGATETKVLGSMSSREKLVVLASLATFWISALPDEWRESGGPEAPDLLHTEFFPRAKKSRNL